MQQSQQRRMAGIPLRWLVAAGYGLGLTLIVALFHGLFASYIQDQAEERIQEVLRETKAFHHYVQQDMHPHYYRLIREGRLPDGFYAPELLSSSYMARSTHRHYNRLRREEGLPEVEYKIASTNPRNPVNLADDQEAALIRWFAEDDSRASYREAYERDGAPWILYARPFLRFTEACLRCHGRPEEAPEQLQAIYRWTGGFGRVQGELAAVEIVRSPLQGKVNALSLFYLVMPGVLALGLMLAFFNRRLRSMVAASTRDLQEANLRLSREVEERRQTEAALSEERARYRRMVENSADGVFLTDGRGRILDANEAALRMLGYAREELLALSVADIDPNVAAYGRRVVEDLPEETGVTIQTAQRRKDGVLLDVEIRACRFSESGKAYSLSLVRDITGRKKAEAELRESEMRFKALHNASFGGIAIHDRGVILDCNQGLSDLFGYAQEELIGMDGLLLTAERFRDLARERILAGYEKPYESFGVRKDGVEFPMRLEARNIPYKGRMARVVEFRDITDVRNSALALMAAKDAAEAANTAKSEFLANMSHELRTPLNGLLNMLKLLQTTDINGEQVEYIEGAIQSGSRLTRLLSDILDLSRVEAGKLALVEEPFPVADLLSSVRETFGPALRGRNLALVVNLGPEVPEHLSGDEVRIRQVLFNLVGNAMKFTESGRIVLTLSAAPRPVPGRLTLLATVEDTGVGIPEDKLDEIFTSFAQADSSYAKKYQGAGLGLAIVRRLTGLMGGEVMVESAPGAGSVFTAAMAVSVASGCRAPLAEPLVPAEPGQAWRILLVEDERINLRSLRYLLDKAGYPVTEAENGREALERLREGEFDLVLMDVQMPVLDGVEATRRIRQGLAGPDRADIPVIALTAYAMPGDRERFLDAGMNAYLSKPADIREILCAIRSVMEARTREGRAEPEEEAQE